MKTLNDIFQEGQLFSLYNAITSAFPLIDFRKVDNYCKFNYGKIRVRDDLKYVDVLDWFYVNESGLTKIYEGLYTTYNPLEDKHIDTKKSNARTTADLKANTTIEGNRVVTEDFPEFTNKHFTTTYDDSSNGRLESYDQSLQNTKTTTTHDSAVGGKNGETTKTGYDGTVSTTFNNETVSGNDISVSHETISGRTGADTAQKMLSNEILLRLNFNFAKIFIDQFLKDMTMCIY